MNSAERTVVEIRCSKCGDVLDEAYQIRHGCIKNGDFVPEADTAEYRCHKCIRPMVRHKPKIMDLQEWLDHQRDQLLEETSSISESID